MSGTFCIIIKGTNQNLDPNDTTQNYERIYHDLKIILNHAEQLICDEKTCHFAKKVNAR